MDSLPDSIILHLFRIYCGKQSIPWNIACVSKRYEKLCSTFEAKLLQKRNLLHLTYTKSSKSSEAKLRFDYCNSFPFNSTSIKLPNDYFEAIFKNPSLFFSLKEVKAKISEEDWENGGDLDVCFATNFGKLHVEFQLNKCSNEPHWYSFGYDDFPDEEHHESVITQEIELSSDGLENYEGYRIEFTEHVTDEGDIHSATGGMTTFETLQKRWGRVISASEIEYTEN